MKNLYSPWRSAYIQTISKKNKSRGCLFCNMAKADSDADNLIVSRGEFCFVVMNKYPYNSGHLLIVPYRHTSLFAKLSNEEHEEIMMMTGKCIQALENISGPQGFNFGANLGRTAGAGIDKHLHFHLVPRWNGDTNFMPVVGKTKVISEYLHKTWKLLRKELKRRK